MKNFFYKLSNWLRQLLIGIFCKRKQLKQAFPEFFAAVKQTYPIPGLKESSSLNLSNKKESCTVMTPQGMTLTENYLLISAYCYDHRHHSVIYVLDRSTGIKIKTVILPDLPHAGGLAYDTTQQKIWLSHTAGPYAAAVAIHLAEIENYIDDSQPIAYQQKVVLKELPHASALTYDRKYLVTALFSLKSFGKIVCYPIESMKNTNLAKRPYQSILEAPFGTLATPKKIQGVTFYKNFLLLSQSWGKQAGKIFVFDIQKTTDFSDTQQAIKIISTPPYLEQICVEDDQLFALFESGAAAYRQKTPFVLKEVLQLNLLELLK